MLTSALYLAAVACCVCRAVGVTSPVHFGWIAAALVIAAQALG